MDDPKTCPEKEGGSGGPDVSGTGSGTQGTASEDPRYSAWERRRPLLIGLLVMLLFWLLPLEELAASRPALLLAGHLDLIGRIIGRWPWLALMTIVLLVGALLAAKLEVVPTKVKVMEVEIELKQIQMKQTEDHIRAQIRNYLSTRRSVFVCYPDYDNYYDVIGSMYKILTFLREQLDKFERSYRTDSETYHDIESMVREIGQFLTRYQSDYRRYYELKIGECEESSQFVPFQDIQNAYPKVGDMTRDLETLNGNMRALAEKFSIDTDKWTGWYQDTSPGGGSGDSGPRNGGPGDSGPGNGGS